MKKRIRDVFYISFNRYTKRKYWLFGEKIQYYYIVGYGVTEAHDYDEFERYYIDVFECDSIHMYYICTDKDVLMKYLNDLKNNDKESFTELMNDFCELQDRTKFERYNFLINLSLKEYRQ